jgi:predicted AAA+ superfamily ATPase
MRPIPRALADRLVEATRFFPAVFVGGCRQAGKTTLLRTAFPDHRYVTLDVPSVAEQADTRPGDLLDPSTPIILDEIQYAPQLPRHLKARIDAGAAPGTFLLTGSQVFQSMERIAESLAGRCATLSLQTLGFRELLDAELLQRDAEFELLQRGGYPRLWAEPDLPRDLFFSSYLATYLERDVRNLVQVGSLRDFERFVRALAARTGALLSYAEISRDVGAAVSTIREWLSVLATSNIVTLLEPYHRSIGKRLIKTPKVYWNDAGFAAWLCGIRSREQLLASPMLGALWETLVHAEIQRAMAEISPGAPLWFWAAHGAAEVDFVIETGGRFQLIEAKLGSHPGADARRGFRAFTAAYGEAAVARRTIVCRTEAAYDLDDGTEVVALADLRLAT